MKRSLVVLLLLGGGAFPVHAQTLMTLGSFNGTNGANPFAGLIADAAGNLFGTTNGGGTSNVGTVFEIAKTASTYGAPATLATFNSTNGANPFAGLITDAAGNLFGTTENSGTSGTGTVFEIAKTASTYGSPTTLATFNGTNGTDPTAGLVADAAGNLFGTTTSGGTSNAGTVFEIAKTASTYGAPTTLATFNTTNGATPYAGLIADAAGNLFGTTTRGGTSNAGTVFEIAKTASTYGSPATLATFNGANGANPYAGLIADAAGNLFGTTAFGGTSGEGTVFEIAKTDSTYGAPATLATFNGTNGANPYAGLIADAAGNLFGTTYRGGTSGEGTVFEIAKTDSTYGAPATLATFNGTNGANPYAGLIADAAGNLFGTTYRGGTSGEGTVFEIAKTDSTYGAPATLATFNGTNGANPYAGLIADAAGNLFGTTYRGGTSGEGTVFEIAKTASTYGSPATLATFNGTNGANSFAGLIANAAGDLFGTTYGGGTSGEGTVFEIANSGFVTSQEVTDVPEPASVALLGAGMAGLATLRRRSGGRKLIGG